jgi:hypothetical protein
MHRRLPSPLGESWWLEGDTTFCTDNQQPARLAFAQRCGFAATRPWLWRFPSLAFNGKSQQIAEVGVKRKVATVLERATLQERQQCAFD